MAQPNTQDPMAKLKADMQSAQRKMNDLQTGVRLTNIRDEMEDYETKTSMLPSKIAAIRTKGYVFGKEFIKRAQNLRSQWVAISPKVLEQVNLHASKLDVDMRTVEATFQQLSARSGNAIGAAPFLSQVNSGVSTLDSKVKSTQNSIRGMYDQFAVGLNKFISRT